MINKKAAALSLLTAAALTLCACQSGEEKEFLKNKAEAEAKTGVVYRTTYFVTTAEEDKDSGIAYPAKKDGEALYYIAARDENGKEVQLTPAAFEDARMGYEAEEGVFLVPAKPDGEKWGYVIADVNAPNTEEISWNTERIYDNAEIYTEGFAAASKDGKYGVINLNGEFVVEPEYDAIKYCCFGVMPALTNGEWYYINLNNEKVFGPFEDAESFAYGYGAVKKGGKWGFIDKNGIDATTFIYDEVYSVEDDDETGVLYAWARTGDKWKKTEITE